MAKGFKTGGRQKGTPNKLGAEIHQMIVTALSDVGGVEYLKEQAKSNPNAFLSLVGKVVPRSLELSGDLTAHHDTMTDEQLDAEIASRIRGIAKETHVNVH